jgi:uncharacterized protein (DUF433 family)
MSELAITINPPTECPHKHQLIHYNPAMERIVVDPDICNGRPTVRGTRITVHTVLEFLGAGDTAEDLLAEYPGLTREDVQARLQYASKLMDNRFTLEHVA